MTEPITDVEAQAILAGDALLDFKPGGPGRTFRVIPVAADHPGLAHLGLEGSSS